MLWYIEDHTKRKSLKSHICWKFSHNRNTTLLEMWSTFSGKWGHWFHKGWGLCQVAVSESNMYICIYIVWSKSNIFKEVWWGKIFLWSFYMTGTSQKVVWRQCLSMARLERAFRWIVSFNFNVSMFVLMFVNVCHCFSMFVKVCLWQSSIKCGVSSQRNLCHFFGS